MPEIRVKKILFVLAPADFRDEEYLTPRKQLEANGIEVEVASKMTSEAIGMFGERAVVNRELREVKLSDYDGIVFVGGTGAAVYFDDQMALNLARTALEQGKVIGAICIAPTILANAGLLTGKRATAFSSESDKLTARGAHYTGEPVTIDGKIVTAHGPEAALDFGRTLVEMLRE